jgi:FkbM family methyltransferase
MQGLLNRVRQRWAGVKWAGLKSVREVVTIRTRQGLLTVSTRDQVIGRQLYQHGHYQHDTACRATLFLRQQGLLPDRGTGVVLDIGCNIGLISIGLLLDGEFQTAIGVEPDPHNFALCKRNVTQNGLDSRFISLQMAASDREALLEFGLSANNFGDHRVQPAGTASGSAGTDDGSDRTLIRVQADRIDAILERLPSAVVESIAFVWIDVQGHEGFVFSGGSELFARNVPVVAEIWPGGLNRSGMGVDRFCEIAAGYWSHFWVWRRAGRYIQYPIGDLRRFCEELGDAEEFEDVIFTRAEPATAPGPARM